MVQVSVGRHELAVRGLVEHVARMTLGGCPVLYSPISRRLVRPDLVECRWVFDGRRPWRMASMWLEGPVVGGSRLRFVGDRDGVLYNAEGVAADAALRAAPEWALEAVQLAQPSKWALKPVA